jgi:dTDP-4-amino-4,6-dideoxygalactose transaminase
LGNALDEFFGVNRCLFLAKGRVGLYAGLRSMNLPPRSKVLMPGYTCFVVPSAVQFARLTPAYVDIDPATYNLDPRRLETINADGISALIVQHTYGIPCDMAPIEHWAAAHNVPVIEDCCHVFGSRYHGRLCGTFGRFAFMSGQWNKPFSTGLGGMLLVNDPTLAESVVRLVEAEVKQPRWSTNLMLRCQIAAYDLLVRPTTAMAMTFVYRALNHLRLVRGSSSPGELRGVMPGDYLTAMAPCQIRRGLREMARIDANIRHRTELTAFYQAELPKLGFQPLGVPEIERQPLLRYPVRVANKSELLKLAVRKGVEIGSWFECPLHPEGTRQEDFGYEDGMCPESERAAREVVNLPTHLRVNRRTAERTLNFLWQHATPIRRSDLS